MAGNLKLLAGLAAGYVLGAKAGRERYERMAEAGRRLAERPEVRELTGKVRAGLGAGLERAAGTASNRLQQVRARIAALEASPGPGPTGQRPPSGRSKRPARRHWPRPRRRPARPTGAGTRATGRRQSPAPPRAEGSGAAADASGAACPGVDRASLAADARMPALAQDSFLGRPQGPPSTTIWATSATGRRDDLAADRMRR